MLYQNKKTKEVIELLHSDNEMCVYTSSAKKDVDHTEEYVAGGVIFKGNKREFKQKYKKASTKQKIDFVSITDDAKEQILEVALGDRYGILNHSAEYFQSNLNMQDNDYRKLHESQTDEEYEAMCEELKDK